ncbi:MAG: YcaO-related McrA-glycine thioamidation protein [Candidatus Nezhaarchaeota archaeon]|nr:YcaO-related McrA-glycine thioamidation protein [Candidatus Nezhaarchaeota archaeon]MCX8141654.1 YcaO-related McrA-glycine thioamidation protein [Candidatus Nezhaarchaeota archaeon]
MEELKLSSCPKKYLIGTHRALEPEKTLESIKPKLATIGVTRVSDITGLDRVGIPVYSCVRPRASEGAISVYSGKGVTSTLAEISAIMEAIERFSAEVKPQNEYRMVKGSYKELSLRYNVLDPSHLILPSSTPYTRSSTLRWIEGFDIANGEKILVPVSAVFHPYSPNDDLHIFRTNTNGLASGNTLEEAILHGLMEVIERDAWSLAELSKQGGKIIEVPESCQLVKSLMWKFEKESIKVILRNITSDLGVPVIAAVSDDLKLRDPALLTIGFGAHLDPEIAAIRALLEVAQSRLVQIQGIREDAYRASLMRIVGYDKIKQFNKHWFSEDDDAESLFRIPNSSKHDILDEIKLVIDILKKRGFERAIIVNLTRPEVAVPTVRVIVPGLEVYGIDQDRIGSRGRECLKSKKR